MINLVYLHNVELLYSLIRLQISKIMFIYLYEYSNLLYNVCVELHITVMYIIEDSDPHDRR